MVERIDERISGEKSGEKMKVIEPAGKRTSRNGRQESKYVKIGLICTERSR